MATPNSLTPSVQILKLPGNIWFTGGTASGSTEIIAEIGTPGTEMAPGSIYISNVTDTAQVWVAQGVVWIELTIP